MVVVGLFFSIIEFWAYIKSLMFGGQEEKILFFEEWWLLGEIKMQENLMEEEVEFLCDQYVMDYLMVVFGYFVVEFFYFWGFMGMVVSFQFGLGFGYILKLFYEKVC